MKRARKLINASLETKFLFKVLRRRRYFKKKYFCLHKIRCISNLF